MHIQYVKLYVNVCLHTLYLCWWIYANIWTVISIDRYIDRYTDDDEKLQMQHAIRVFHMEHGLCLPVPRAGTGNTTWRGRSSGQIACNQKILRAGRRHLDLSLPQNNIFKYWFLDSLINGQSNGGKPSRLTGILHYSSDDFLWTRHVTFPSKIILIFLQVLSHENF